VKKMTKNLMLPFYFGSVSESDRLYLERELLTDSEVLVEYLDLKRSIEDASLPETSPSPQVWTRIQSLRGVSKKSWISISVGAVAVAALLLIFVFNGNIPPSEISPPQLEGVLFDSSSELSVSSSVL
jgi:hypothetical protein